MMRGSSTRSATCHRRHRDRSGRPVLLPETILALGDGCSRLKSSETSINGIHHGGLTHGDIR